MLSKGLEWRHAQAYRAAIQALLPSTEPREAGSFSGRAGKTIINLLSFPAIGLSFQTLTIWTEMQYSKCLPQADVFSFTENNYYTAIAIPSFQKAFCATLILSLVCTYYEFI